MYIKKSMKTITKKRYRLNGIALAPYGDVSKIKKELCEIIGVTSRVTIHNYVTGHFQPSLSIATAVSEYFEKNYGIKENVWVEVEEPQTVNS